MQELVRQHYPQYLSYLRTLVSYPSVFSNPDDVKKAITVCHDIMKENAVGYDVYFDQQQNVIACPKHIDESKPIVYLSAHIDTVGADATEWDSPYQPYQLYEDENEIVARGVCDCKSGVAFELFLTALLKEQLCVLNNIVFTVTFKEEGAGQKTASEIGQAIGSTLPISEQCTYLLVLENNVKLSAKPVLSIYNAEKCNYVVCLSGSLSYLQEVLGQLTHWNPVAIKPDEAVDVTGARIIEQPSGHAASVTREQNALTAVILEASADSIIQAGDAENFATVPTKIHVSSGKKEIRHTVVINNRSLDTQADVDQQLAGLEYTPLCDMDAGAGFDLRSTMNQYEIFQYFEECRSDDIEIEFGINSGSSDAKHISSVLPPEYRRHFVPIVAGPGTRSQREVSPQRITHGKNETFDKESGYAAVTLLCSVLEKLHCITPT